MLLLNCILDQINIALVSIRDIFQKRLKNLNYSKLSSVTLQRIQQYIIIKWRLHSLIICIQYYVLVSYLFSCRLRKNLTLRWWVRSRVSSTHSDWISTWKETWGMISDSMLMMVRLILLCPLGLNITKYIQWCVFICSCSGRGAGLCHVYGRSGRPGHSVSVDFRSTGDLSHIGSDSHSVPTGFWT